MSKLPTNEYQKTYADKLVDLFLEERSNYEQKSIKLSDRASHNMYKTIQQVKTHQNKAFLIDIASAVNTLNVNDVKTAREDDREFYDIITPMIETAVVNVDIDTGHLDPYIDKPGFQAHQYAAKSLLQKFMMDTNHGVKMNEEIEQFMDDGNLIARQIDDKGEIYRLVLPQNIILGDPSAKSLEDTSVQERDTINQTELRAMKGWDNIQKVIDQCNAGSATIPFYEVFFRYGELSKEVLGNVKREVHGSDYQRQDDDDKTFIQTLTVMVRAVSGSSRAADEQAENTKAIEGIIVFAEELKPKTIQITKRLKVT